MKNLIKILTTISVFLGFFLNSAYADPKKIGFIYIGPPGDHGWTYMHDVGRQHMENQLGGAVTSTYIEGVPENADAVRAIRKLASSGHDLIFTTSFNYMDQTLEVAKDFPDIKFEHATGYIQADNVIAYVFLIPTIVSGRITLGIMNQILRAFGQVASSFQFLVNSWTTIIDLPEDHGQGSYWYHPHYHPSVNQQVYGGASGFMQIGDPLSKIPGFKDVPRNLAVLKMMDVGVDPETGELQLDAFDNYGGPLTNAMTIFLSFFKSSSASCSAYAF